MFYRSIDHQLSLSLTIPAFADELYELTNQNRSFLQEWLPWLDHVKTSSDTHVFIEEQLRLFSQSKGVHCSIFFEGQLAGVVGYNTIDKINSIGSIGYWLAETFNGRGIMTRCVEDVIQLGRDYHQLQKIEIRCATENTKSRAIPQRLGFTEEGTLRKVEKVNNQWLDHVVYGLISE